mmetsp:Transcript_32131/g.108161  ORF Transcript_32131/g.108161 Transcript_32131/m.108161 type:complete len:202 (+) Transcript_32131:558-1163(+)
MYETTRGCARTAFSSKPTTRRRFRSVARETAVYACPASKQPFKSTSRRSRVWPWALWIEMHQASRSGNWVREAFVVEPSSTFETSRPILCEVPDANFTKINSMSFSVPKSAARPGGVWKLRKASTTPRAPLTRPCSMSVLARSMTCAPTFNASAAGKLELRCSADKCGSAPESFADISKASPGKDLREARRWALTLSTSAL